MRKKTHPRRTRTTLQAIGIGALCVAGSFFMGVRTAGDVEPFSHSEAAVLQVTAEQKASCAPGDANRDGILNARDAIAILEIAQGYRVGTHDEVECADTDGNAVLDARDALSVLHQIAQH